VKIDSVSNPQVLFDAVLRALPAFKPVYDQHLADNHELLPHVLMADLSRLILGACRQARQAPPELEPVLALLERAIDSGDKSLFDLIAGSFIEGVAGEPGLEVLRNHLGPSLLKQLAVYEAL
jgi:hypothetical protein